MRYRRFGQLRRYRPWLVALLDRLGLYPNDVPIGLLVRGMNRDFRVCVESGKSDIGRINEVLFDAPYVRFFDFDRVVPRELVVVDVGANKGLFSLSVADHAPMKAYCYEPIAANLRYLRANVEMNDLTSTVLPVAIVPDDSHSVRMNIASSPGQHSVLTEEQLSLVTEHPIRFTGEVDTVPARNLNAELQRIIAAEKRIDILKLDVEGLELELLCSIEDETWTHLRYVVAEVWKKQAQGPEFKSLASRLGTLGREVRVDDNYVYITLS